jgi:hypothetical protein
MRKTGLRDWIIKFLDGKADVALVDRWVNIPRNNGLVHFFNPARVRHAGASTFFCSGSEPASERPFGCEAVRSTAIDLGVATATDVITSRDRTPGDAPHLAPAGRK